jgi:prepilin signal peptidase PulO-like enzyme (type II secretory pathway)
MEYTSSAVWTVAVLSMVFWQLKESIILKGSSMDEDPKPEDDVLWWLEKTVSPLKIKIKWMLMIAATMLVSAALGYLGYLNTVSWTDNMKIMVGFACLVPAAWIDCQKRIIPNLLVAIMFGARLVIFGAEFFTARETCLMQGLSSVIGGAVIFGVFFLFSRLSRGGVGMGDVKLLSAYGFLCGLYAVCGTVLFALLICVAVSVFLLILKKKGVKDTLPFGPFILCGNTIALFLGVF